jgi:hypothetical protein
VQIAKLPILSGIRGDDRRKTFLNYLYIVTPGITFHLYLVHDTYSLELSKFDAKSEKGDYFWSNFKFQDVIMFSYVNWG